MPKKLYIIDGHSQIYADYWAKMSWLTSPSGEPTKIPYIFTTALLKLINNQKPDMLVVMMDSKTPTFRSKIYLSYKANRPPMPDDMPVQIKRLEEILNAMRIPVFRIDGFEADDLIGTLAKKASADGIDTYICSKDKDMLQLLDDHIFIYDLKTSERTDINTMSAEMGISPAQFIDCLALEGDAIDNVPGVPGIGGVNACKLIREYGSLDGIYEHLDQITDKRGENLKNSKDVAYLSKKLVTIDCNTPLKIDYDSLALKEADKPKLAQIFTELGFSRLLSQLGLDGPAAAGGEPSAPAVPQDLGRPASVKTVEHDYQLVDTQEKFGKFLGELKKQKLFTVDTETTAIEPMRAQLAGISFCWQPYRVFYLAIKAPLGSKHLDIDIVRKELAPIMADDRIKKIGQNIKYDTLVMQNALMPIKGICFDTMVASYCLDSERNSHSLDNMAKDFLNYEGIPLRSLIGKGKNQLTFDMVDTAAACEYSGEDADLTFQLYIYLKERLEKEPLLMRLFEQVEMPLVSVLAAMEYNGVSIDTMLLKKMSREITESLETLTDRIYELAGAVFNIDSPKQLAEVLFNKLQLRPVRSGKTTLSTDADVLDELAGRHPIIKLILEYRQLSKLRNTYADKLGLLINSKTGRLHASFNQTVTATGRLSSSNPNLQNIPIRTELGSKVRAAFIPAKKSDCILSADYSQIEIRLLAHFSKDKTLMAAFAADQDIHSFVASQIYNVPIEEVTAQMRSRCKAVNFGIIYGQGAFGLSQSVGISRSEAKKFIDSYFERYSSIRKFMDNVIATTKETGYAETILHRRRKISDLSSKNGAKRAQAQRLAVNTVIQGSAADLIKVAMINIQRKIELENLPVKLILQIHDELVFELPAADAESHARWISKEMTEAISLDVPMKVDITYGPSWLAEK